MNGVFHEFEEYIRERPSPLAWLHRHSVYDVLLWVIGFPFAFWSVARASPAVQRVSTSSFVQAALYMYIFLAANFGIRILFHYTRWIWPLVELRHSRSRALAHKAAWTTIVLGMISTLIVDLLKRLL